MSIEAVNSRDGHTYWIESEDTLYKQRLSAGQYQGNNWRFIQQHIQDFRNCLDIGSNNACNAIHYAKRFGHVYCWEPTQLAQQLWRNTVRDNSTQNVTLHTEALAETHKTTEIVIHEKNGGHNHLDNRTTPTWTGKKWIQKQYNTQRRRQLQSVDCRPLDDYKLQEVDFIKIDVEGYEWFVLKGAEQTLQANRPILQLEIVASQCRKFGYWGEQMIEWLRDRDYRALSKKRGWLDGEFRSYRTHLLHNDEHTRGDMDYFFIPQERDLQLNRYEQLFDE